MFKPLKDIIIDRWNDWDLGPKPKDVSFIRRTSTWLGDAGKIVFYAFPRGAKFPVLIAKTVQSSEFGKTIQKESQNIQLIWNTVSEEFRESIPCPLGLSEVNGIPIYFEKAIPGITLPERFAWRWFKKSKEKLLREAVAEISRWLVDFHNAIGLKKVTLDSDVVEKQFISTLRRFNFTRDLTADEQSYISRLEEIAISLEGGIVTLPPIHGDFWGGSLLWGKDGKMRVIDWEFFELQGLPLQDFLYFAIHPGFVIKNRGKNGLLGEFINLFYDNYFSELIREQLKAHTKAAGVESPEVIELLMAMVLIRLSLERDSKNKTKDSWAHLFRYLLKNRSDCVIFQS